MYIYTREKNIQPMYMLNLEGKPVTVVEVSANAGDKYTKVSKTSYN